MFELRPATLADTELLWAIQCETLSEYISAEFDTDLDGQRAFFDEHFKVLSHQLVLVDGAVSGHHLQRVEYATNRVNVTHRSSSRARRIGLSPPTPAPPHCALLPVSPRRSSGGGTR